jgi:hypothetical protein
MELVSDLDLIVSLAKFAGPIPISIVVVYNYFASIKISILCTSVVAIKLR